MKHFAFSHSHQPCFWISEIHKGYPIGQGVAPSPRTFPRPSDPAQTQGLAKPGLAQPYL